MFSSAKLAWLAAALLAFTAPCALALSPMTHFVCSDDCEGLCHVCELHCQHMGQQAASMIGCSAQRWQASLQAGNFPPVVESSCECVDEGTAASLAADIADAQVERQMESFRAGARRLAEDAEPAQATLSLQQAQQKQQAQELHVPGGYIRELLLLSCRVHYPAECGAGDSSARLAVACTDAACSNIACECGDHAEGLQLEGNLDALELDALSSILSSGSSL